MKIYNMHIAYLKFKKYEIYNDSIIQFTKVFLLFLKLYNKIVIDEKNIYHFF